MSESLNFPLPFGYGWQYHFLLWLQSFHAPWLEKAAVWLSWIGTERFYILVLPILFWAVNRQIGLRIAYAFLVSTYCNVWLKDWIRIARPVGVPGIVSKYVSSATEVYSMPAGHAQGPATFWFLLGKWIKQPWFWVIAVMLVFAIGFSRLVLGLHWPSDVLVGWFIGWVFAVAGWALGRWWSYRQYGFSIRMTFAIGLPALFILIHNGMPSFQYATLLLGVGVGAAIEERWFRIDIDKQIWTRLCALVIGFAGLIGLQMLERWLGPAWWSVFTVNTVVGLWITLGAPYVFVKCGLYRGAE